MATNKEESLEAKVFRNNYAIMGKAVKDHLADLAPEFYAKDVITADIRDSLLKQHAPNTLLKAIESKIATGETTTFETTMEIFASNSGTKHIVEKMKHNLQVLIDQNRETPDDSTKQVSRPTNIRSQPVNAAPSPQTNICKAKAPIQQMSSPTPTDEFRRLRVTEKGATKYANTVQAFSEQTTQRSETMVTSEVKVPVTVTSHFTHSEVDDLRQQLKEHELVTAQKFEEQNQQLEEHNQRFEQLQDCRMQLLLLENNHQKLEEQLSKVLDELEIVKGREMEAQGRIKELELENEKGREREAQKDSELEIVKGREREAQSRIKELEVKEKRLEEELQTVKKECLTSQERLLHERVEKD